MDIPILKLEDTVTVSCYDEEKTSDDLICEGTFRLKELVTNGKERWIKLEYKNKLAGEVLIEGNMQSIEEYEKEIYQDQNEEELDHSKAVLALKIVEAQLIRDTEMFGKMDPFMMVEVNERKYRTQVILEGGKNPVFDKVFFIPVDSMGDEILVSCYDEDRLTNDLVGSVSIPMYSLCRAGGIRDWFDILYKKRVSGKVFLESIYKPPGDTTSKKNDGGLGVQLFSNFQKNLKNNMLSKIGQFKT